MRWTLEQLNAHPKRDNLLGLTKPGAPPKCSNEVLIEAYNRTGSVWKTAEAAGLCGQSVWERLTRLNIITPDDYTAEQEKLIENFYGTGFQKGELLKFCARNKLRVTSVSRWARKRGLITTSHRTCADSVVDAMAIKSKQWHHENPHPKGMLGKQHSITALKAIGQASSEAAANRTKSERQAIAQKMLKTKAAGGQLLTPRKGSWKQGWYLIGKRRVYMRSRWEVNYAFYLEMLIKTGDVLAWEYEPETFWFEGIKRGTTNYTPDFKVALANGKIEYHEVKGWMDDRSKTKIKRMKKYHPTVTLIVRDSVWFKEHRSLKNQIPGWV